MRDATTISELRAALRRQGIWGARAERLMQEWADHVREDAAQRAEKGAAPEAAQDAAWKALGNPDVLAARAGSELARASWSGRHPWLAGLALPALAWFALVIAVTVLPPCIALVYWDGGALPRNHPDAVLAGLRCWQAVVNWLPWLLSMAWLARTAVRMPGGWKHFWITAGVLTLCSTSLWTRIDPPLHGPNSGSLMIYASGILGLIVDALLRLMGFRGLGPWLSWPKNIAHMAPSLIQAAIMALGLLAFHFKATARSEDTGAVQLS
jgi:hypothetical protein